MLLFILNKIFKNAYTRFKKIMREKIKQTR